MAIIGATHESWSMTSPAAALRSRLAGGTQSPASPALSGRAGGGIHAFSGAHGASKRRDAARPWSGLESGRQELLCAEASSKSCFVVFLNTALLFSRLFACLHSENPLR